METGRSVHARGGRNSPEIEIKDPEELKPRSATFQAMVQEPSHSCPRPPEFAWRFLVQSSPCDSLLPRSILNLGVEQEQKMLEANSADELLRWRTPTFLESWKLFNCVRRLPPKRNRKWISRSANYILRPDEGDSEGTARTKARTS